MAKAQLRYAVIIDGKVDEIIVGPLGGKTRTYDRIEDVTERPDIVVGTAYPFTLYSEYLKTLKAEEAIDGNH